CHVADRHPPGEGVRRQRHCSDDLGRHRSEEKTEQTKRDFQARGYERAFTMKWIMIAGTTAAAFCFAAAVPITEANAVTTSPFARLIGRWVGAGMIGYKSSPPERIKCRATYLMADTQDELKQTIRCATTGGNVEIVSNVKEAGGKLSGHW